MLDANPDSETLYNSAWLLGADGRALGLYDKNYLLAFGDTFRSAIAFPSGAKA